MTKTKQLHKGHRAAINNARERYYRHCAKIERDGKAAFNVQNKLIHDANRANIPMIVVYQFLLLVLKAREKLHRKLRPFDAVHESLMGEAAVA